MVLVGGLLLCILYCVGYFILLGLMVLVVGYCWFFDVWVDGMVFGSGVGLVVFKLLVVVIDVGDWIYVVICGLVINNDGLVKMGYVVFNLVV